jgi:hypothetical protein
MDFAPRCKNNTAMTPRFVRVIRSIQFGVCVTFILGSALLICVVWGFIQLMGAIIKMIL